MNLFIENKNCVFYTKPHIAIHSRPYHYLLVKNRAALIRRFHVVLSAATVLASYVYDALHLLFFSVMKAFKDVLKLASLGS